LAPLTRAANNLGLEVGMDAMMAAPSPDARHWISFGRPLRPAALGDYPDNPD
jgi:hypothetical protein